MAVLAPLSTPMRRDHWILVDLILTLFYCSAPVTNEFASSDLFIISTRINHVQPAEPFLAQMEPCPQPLPPDLHSAAYVTTHMFLLKLQKRCQCNVFYLSSNTA